MLDTTDSSRIGTGSVEGELLVSWTIEVVTGPGIEIGWNYNIGPKKRCVDLFRKTPYSNTEYRVT